MKRRARQLAADRRSSRLARAQVGDRSELFTEAVGGLPPVYGERWVEVDGRAFRAFEPGRSKLAAGIARAWTGPVPKSGERWLYLGAATGTTASHIADLVGPNGAVYAIERSPRPFARLLALAERWPPLLPILGDARALRDYSALVPPVAGIYVDVAQPDQVEIVRSNAALFLERPGGAVVVALKTASMGRERDPAGHLREAEAQLRPLVELAPSVRLDPFHKGHYLVGGHARGELFRLDSSPAARPSPVRRRARPRP